MLSAINARTVVSVAREYLDSRTDWDERLNDHYDEITDLIDEVVTGYSSTTDLFNFMVRHDVFGKLDDGEDDDHDEEHSGGVSIYEDRETGNIRQSFDSYEDFEDYFGDTDPSEYL